MNFVELDIEVMIRIVSNKYIHHEILNGTPPPGIFQGPCMSTANFENNEAGIKQLHTDRIECFKPKTHTKNDCKTSIKNKRSIEHHKFDEIGMQAYQKMIDKTANLLRSPLNFKNKT